MPDDYLTWQAREKLRDTSSMAVTMIMARKRLLSRNVDTATKRFLLHAKIAAALLVAAMPEEE